MTKPCVFALGLALGAWTVPIATIYAARLSGRHYLSAGVEITDAGRTVPAPRG